MNLKTFQTNASGKNEQAESTIWQTALKRCCLMEFYECKICTRPICYNFLIISNQMNVIQVLHKMDQLKGFRNFQVW